MNKYDDVYDSFINGNRQQFVRQFDELEDKADFINYMVSDLYITHTLIAMIKLYFTIKEA